MDDLHHLLPCVLYFSIVTILSGFAPNYIFFAVMRALYGIGMGGYWGIGASFAMENAPRKRRGVLSGMMQGGYPFGYLLAAVGMLTIMSQFGWRAMFVVGSSLASVIVFLTYLSPESEAWKQHRMGSIGSIFRTLFQHLGSLSYLHLVMVVMSCISHGSQDLYRRCAQFVSWVCLSARSLHCFARDFLLNISYGTGLAIPGRSPSSKLSSAYFFCSSSALDANNAAVAFADRNLYDGLPMGASVCGMGRMRIPAVTQRKAHSPDLWQE
jgi:MFS family permease